MGVTLNLANIISYFLQKFKKKQTPDKRFALLKNDITKSQTFCRIVWMD